VKFSEAERLILINQYQILSMLTTDSHEKEYYDLGREALEEGYEQLYDEFLPSVAAPLSSDVFHLVFDILDVYRTIHYYVINNPDDVEVTANPGSTFAGFDGNEETEYLALTRFVVNKMGRYDEQASLGSDDFNSHRPMVEKYQHMIEAWKSLGGYSAKLTKEQVLLLLATK